MYSNSGERFVRNLTLMRRRFFRIFRIVVLLAATMLMMQRTPAAAQTSDAADIVLGMSTALSGPAADLGTNMHIGVLAGLERINRDGGIKGRKLRLMVMDDGYEPAQTAPNMRKLIAEKKVLAIIGNVGTPTAIAAIPIANELKTLFFGAYTGAGVLRNQPPDRYVINFRASYAEEVGTMIEALIRHGGVKTNEIAFFTQRDGYGDAGFSGGIAALKRYGLKDENIVLHTRYERNTLAVEDSVADILFANPSPRAIIMVGAYAPCAKFIKLAKQSGSKALFLNVSFVGSASLARGLGKGFENVIVTQVVPHYTANTPIIQGYREDLRKLSPALPLNFGSLEGYIAANIFIRALESLPGELNRETIVDALESMGDFDIGLGELLHLGPDDHQASHGVWPTILKDGDFVPFDWLKLSNILNTE
jgi:ABC-type branched-subunit amino acid transport system substrate-binding protein